MNSDGTPIDSFYVPAELDDGMSRWYHKWCGPCCHPGSCSEASKDEVSKSTSFIDEDSVKKFVVNHLYSSWEHTEVTTWAEGEEVAKSYLEASPDTIKQVEETPEERRHYRATMEQHWEQKKRDDEAKAAAAQAKKKGGEKGHEKGAEKGVAHDAYPEDCYYEDWTYEESSYEEGPKSHMHEQYAGRSAKRGKRKGSASSGKGHVARQARAIQSYASTASDEIMRVLEEAGADQPIELAGEYVTLRLSLVRSLLDSVVRVRNSAVQLELIATGLLNQVKHEKRVLETATSHLMEAANRADFR